MRERAHVGRVALARRVGNVISNFSRLVLAGTLAVVASSQAEAQQAVSVPGTPGWGANSGYPAASPWRKPWPRAGVPGQRGRRATYQYPTAVPYQGYTAPMQGYYYYYPSTTPGYTQAAQPAYTVTPQTMYYAPATQIAVPATQPIAPTYAPAAQSTAPAAVQP